MSKEPELIGTVTVAPSELHDRLQNELGYLKFLITELESTKAKIDVLEQLKNVNDCVELSFKVLNIQYEFHNNFTKVFAPYSETVN